MFSSNSRLAASRGEVAIRRPVRADGVAASELIANSPPLDANSLYCNLLQCTHFADTSAVAELDGKLVGFASGYLIPAKDRVALFIWQIAVAEEVRGQNIARRLILDIWQRKCCHEAEWIESTIGLENGASWNLFESIARGLNAKTRREVMFDRDADFEGMHESEIKLRIGPISRVKTPRRVAALEVAS